MQQQEQKENATPLLPKAPFKRRTLFIKKNMQLRYMFLIVSSVVMGIAIMGFEVISTLHEVFSQHPMLLQPFYDNLTSISFVLGLKILIYVVLVILLASILSHKMAGPIYRFEQTCRDVAKGDFTKRVHLRKGDKFMDLQDEFNAMMDTVEKEINKNRDGKNNDN